MSNESPVDDEYDAIVRKETVERVDRILKALRAAERTPPWDAIYREAHSLASIAGHLDIHYADAARDLASRLRDSNGQLVHLEGQDAERAREDARHLSEGLHRLAMHDHQ